MFLCPKREVVGPIAGLGGGESQLGRLARPRPPAEAPSRETETPLPACGGLGRRLGAAAWGFNRPKPSRGGLTTLFSPPARPENDCCPLLLARVRRGSLTGARSSIIVRHRDRWTVARLSPRRPPRRVHPLPTLWRETPVPEVAPSGRRRRNRCPAGCSRAAHRGAAGASLPTAPSLSTPLEARRGGGGGGGQRVVEDRGLEAGAGALGWIGLGPRRRADALLSALPGRLRPSALPPRAPLPRVATDCRKPPNVHVAPPRPSLPNVPDALSCPLYLALSPPLRPQAHTREAARTRPPTPRRPGPRPPAAPLPRGCPATHRAPPGPRPGGVRAGGGPPARGG